MLKLGIIREGKTPPDSRVPLTPALCKMVADMGVDLVVQPSSIRCYSDEEYKVKASGCKKILVTEIFF